MNTGIDLYLEALERKLWAKREAKDDILGELRSHLERALGGSPGASLQDAERILGSPDQLARQINQSLALDRTEVPSSVQGLVVGAFAALNVALWYGVQQASGWVHGLSARAGSLSIIAIYAVGTLICIAAGCALAARARSPRLLLYLIAACPALYHLLFGVLEQALGMAVGRASLDAAVMGIVHRLPQVLLLTALGAVTAWVTLRVSRYPAEPWHV